MNEMSEDIRDKHADEVAGVDGTDDGGRPLLDRNLEGKGIPSRRRAAIVCEGRCRGRVSARYDQARRCSSMDEHFLGTQEADALGVDLIAAEETETICEAATRRRERAGVTKSILRGGR